MTTPLINQARIDKSVAAHARREPYFAANYAAARRVLNTAIVCVDSAGAILLRFPGGIVTDAEGCHSCRGCECLHVTARKLYTEEG
jgi:hypothetical protein